MKRFLAGIFLVLLSLNSNAQVDHQVFSDEVRGLPLGVSTVLDVVVDENPSISPLNKKISAAKLQVHWTIDDVFLLGGGSNGDVIEDYTVEFVCRYYETGNPVEVLAETSTLSISSLEAEALFSKDITTQCLTYDIEHVEIEVIALSPATVGANYSAQQTEILAYVEHHRILHASIDINYGIDVRLESTLNPAASPVITGFGSGHLSSRVQQFDWSATTHNFPNYELQLLKLENNNDLLTDEESITAIVDWNNALKIETTNAGKSVRLTIAEGTGFYAWRVRAIGNYYEGGFSNAKNYGPWSGAFSQGQEVTITESDLSNFPFLLFLDDPDDDKNWMYSRVIMEEHKVGESMVYANNLLQSVQSQGYSSSAGKSLISQTVLDYLGRPTLSTLPIPKDAIGLNGYEDQFLLNTNGELYTADDFDSDATIQSPGMAKDDLGTNFSYYSDNNTDDYSIPDAEGYPFSRAIYLTDGSGRIAESSGVGKVHAIGQGHTSKILYGTPSDDELIAIFGDEAPPAVNILKTVTIDPNGTASIAYTTIEGLTIATAMSSVSPDNLLAIDNPGDAGVYSQLVADEVVVNTYADHKFISSKVLALDQTTVIDIDYYPCTQSGIDLSPEGCPGGNCNFEVRFIVTNIVTGEKFGTDYMNVDLGSCSSEIPGEHFNWEVITAGEGLYSYNGNQITLPAGNWKIQKVVSSMTNPATMYEVSDAQQYLGPLIDLVAGWMNNATTEQQLEDFNAMLDTLINNLDAGHALGQAACSGQPDDCFMSAVYQDNFWSGYLGEYFNRMDTLYGFPTDFVFHPGYTLEYGFELDEQGNPTTVTDQSQLVMTTTCCGDLGTNIPAVEKYPVCKTIDAILEDTQQELTEEDVLFSELFRTLYYEILDESNPDAYLTEWGANGNLVGAMNGFGGIEVPVGADTIFTSDFDKMIYHMLTDQYFTGNAYTNLTGDWVWESPDAGVVPVYNSTGDLIPAGASEEFYGPYYTCDFLYECWYATIRAYFELKKTPSGFDIYSESNSDESENGEAGPGDDTAGGHYDDDESADGNQGILEQLVSFIISVKMDDFSEDLSGDGSGSSGASPMALQYDIPNTFMECAGRNFAAIIDIPEDDVNNQNASGIAADLGEVNTPVFLNDLAEYVDGKEVVLAKKVEEDSNNPGEFLTTLIPDRLRYENIKSPIWMFKYYEYNPELDPAQSSNNYENMDPNEETNYVLSSEGALELTTCYHDFSGLNLCYAPPCIDTDHHNWNATERYTFYKQVANIGVPDDLDDDSGNSLCQSLPVLEPLNCDSLNDLIEIDFDNALQSCSDRQDYFRSQIVEMLNFNCYEIVECVDVASEGLVSEAQIDAMVQEAVVSCGAYIEALKVNCVDPLTCMTEFPTYADASCTMLIPRPSGGVEVCTSTERIITLYDPTYKIPEKLLRVRSGVFIPFMNDLQTNCSESPYEIESEPEECNEMNGQYTEVINVE